MSFAHIGKIVKGEEVIYTFISLDKWNCSRLDVALSTREEKNWDGTSTELMTQSGTERQDDPHFYVTTLLSKYQPTLGNLSGGMGGWSSVTQHIMIRGWIEELGFLIQIHN